MENERRQVGKVFPGAALFTGQVDSPCQWDLQNSRKAGEAVAPLTSPYWLSIRMTRSVRLKTSRQSKLGMSWCRSSGVPLCRKLRMCREENGASSSVRSMKSITDGLWMVS